MILILLPAVAICAGITGAQIATGAATTLPLPPVVETAEYLSNKSMAVWFLTLAGIAILSWTWVFKWLINQLDSQRTANAELTKQLIGYMESDRSALTALVTKANNTIETALHKISEEKVTH